MSDARPTLPSPQPTCVLAHRTELARKAFMADGGTDSGRLATGGASIAPKELTEMLKAINAIFGK